MKPNNFLCTPHCNTAIFIRYRGNQMGWFLIHLIIKCCSKLCNYIFLFLWKNESNNLSFSVAICVLQSKHSQYTFLFLFMNCFIRPFCGLNPTINWYAHALSLMVDVDFYFFKLQIMHRFCISILLSITPLTVIVVVLFL